MFASYILTQPLAPLTAVKVTKPLPKAKSVVQCSFLLPNLILPWLFVMYLAKVFALMRVGGFPRKEA